MSREDSGGLPLVWSRALARKGVKGMIAGNSPTLNGMKLRRIICAATAAIGADGHTRTPIELVRASTVARWGCLMLFLHTVWLISQELPH